MAPRGGYWNGEIGVASKDPAEKPKVPFYYSNEHDQGMGVPARCRCGGDLHLKPLGWTCERCGCGYGK